MTTWAAIQRSAVLATLLEVETGRSSSTEALDHLDMMGLRSVARDMLAERRRARQAPTGRRAAS